MRVCKGETGVKVMVGGLKSDEEIEAITTNTKEIGK